MLSNPDLLILAITVASILILGVTIYLNNRKSITNKSFFLFCGLTAVWGVSNYFNYQFRSPEELILWVLRTHIFLSIWHAFSFFQLAFVFPKNEIKFPRWYRYLVLLVVISAIINLTPLTFSKVTNIPLPGVAAETEKGPGMLLFAILALGLVGSGIYRLFSETIKSPFFERRQRFLILFGACITFLLILTFNLILPSFNKLALIPFGVAAILPFIIFTSYSIIKHRLFNVKVIATETLTFALWLLLLTRTVGAENLPERITEGVILVATVVLGIFLIKSVLKEVETRERMEEMAVKLEVANEELKKIDEAKSDFISIASHQLRTPLSIIKGYISMIREGTFGVINERLTDPLHKIYISNERLINLVSDLLDLSRMERGKMQFDFKVTRFSEIVDGLVHDFKIVANKKGLDFIWERQNKYDEIWGDENKLRQVILNLIDNAVKYTAHGSIQVKLEESDNNLKFSVRDTGPGLSEEDLNRLFQKFSRVQSGEKSHVEGLGLGLYVAKLIIQAHQGELLVESPGKGKGSTFSLVLPLYKESPQRISMRAETSV